MESRKTSLEEAMIGTSPIESVVRRRIQFRRDDYLGARRHEICLQTRERESLEACTCMCCV